MKTLKNLFLILALITCFAAPACDTGNLNGYTECSYDYSGTISDVNAVTVLYPCALTTNSAKYNAVTLSGGFANGKSDMYWLGTYLAENGYVVFTLSASDNSSVSGYEKAQKAVLAKITSENANTSSILYGRIAKKGLMGYSMGGGGILNAAADLGSGVDVAVGMAPYSPQSNLSAVTAPTLLVVGSDDTVAYPSSNAEPAYSNLGDIIKILAELDSFGHLSWVQNSGTDAETTAAKVLILNFLNYTLNGDSTALTALKNPSSVFVTYETNNL